MIRVANADLAKPRGMISSTLAETPLSDSAVLQDISATAKPMVTVLRVNNKYVCLPIEPMARLIKSKKVNCIKPNSLPEANPANRATATKATVRENIQTQNARTRGTTRYRNGSMPWASSM